MKILKAYKYKLELTKEQEKILFDWLGILRYLYNSALKQRIVNYDNFRKNTSYEDQANELPDVKEVFPWIANVPSQALQQKLALKKTSVKQKPKQGASLASATSVA